MEEDDPFDFYEDWENGVDRADAYHDLLSGESVSRISSKTYLLLQSASSLSDEEVSAQGGNSRDLEKETMKLERGTLKQDNIGIKNGNDNLQQRKAISLSKTPEECPHDIQKVYCGCDDKNEIFICFRCHEIFCSRKCFIERKKDETQKASVDTDITREEIAKNRKPEANLEKQSQSPSNVEKSQRNSYEEPKVSETKGNKVFTYKRYQPAKASQKSFSFKEQQRNKKFPQNFNKVEQKGHGGLPYFCSFPPPSNTESMGLSHPQFSRHHPNVEVFNSKDREFGSSSGAAPFHRHEHTLSEGNKPNFQHQVDKKGQDTQDTQGPSRSENQNRCEVVNIPRRKYDTDTVYTPRNVGMRENPCEEGGGSKSWNPRREKSAMVKTSYVNGRGESESGKKERRDLQTSNRNIQSQNQLPGQSSAAISAHGASQNTKSNPHQGSSTSCTNQVTNGNRGSIKSNKNGKVETSFSSQKIGIDTNIPIGIFLPVMLVRGNNFNDLTFMTHDGFRDFKVLQKNLQKCPKLKMDVMEAGDLCLVEYASLNGKGSEWYRGEIMDIALKSNSVYLLDYGVKISVPPGEIRQIPAEYTEVKELSVIRMRVLHVKLDERDEVDASEHFDSLMNGKSMRIRITHQDTTKFKKLAGDLEILHINKWYSIGEYLQMHLWENKASKDDIKREEEQGRIIPLNHPTWETNKNEIIASDHQRILVTLTHVESLTEFYVSTRESLKRKSRIESDLNKLDVEAGKCPLALKHLSNRILAMFDADFDMWVRVIVLEIITLGGNKSKVIVFKIDTGEKQIAQMNSLRLIPFNLCQPSSVFKCSLPVTPARSKRSHMDEAFNILKSNIHQRLKAVVLSNTTEEPVFVELFLGDEEKGCTSYFLEKEWIQLSRNYNLSRPYN